jgi:hypothetical protein
MQRCTRVVRDRRGIAGVALPGEPQQPAYHKATWFTFASLDHL